MSRVALALLALFILAPCSSGDPPDAECIEDRKCAKVRSMNEWFIKAKAICTDLVSGRATYAHRWTDGIKDKFPSVVWLHTDKKVRISGSYIEFQDQLGGWHKMSYTCTYDPISKAVTDVTVR